MQRDSKKILKMSSLGIFFLIILLYALWGAKDVILGVKIKNVNIENGANFEESAVKLSGNAKNALNIKINGREISIDQSGNWEETIALISGYNLVQIEAVDKFGNIDQKNYQLTYSPKTEANQNGEENQEGSE